jgi:hypothetical protein
MSSTPSLKTFLKEKKERDEESGRLADKAEKIELRRSAIAKLFDEIEAWLKPSDPTDRMAARARVALPFARFGHSHGARDRRVV